MGEPVNTSVPRQGGRHFEDDIVIYIPYRVYGIVFIMIQISPEFFPKGPIHDKQVLYHLI